MPTTMDIEGHTHNTSSEAFLNKLCEYFANVGATKDAKSLNNLALTVRSKRCCQSFVLHEITEVDTCINNIKSQSAPGLDGISPKFIKFSQVVLTPFLTRLFNKRISQKAFPDSFKTAAIIPIPKISSPNSMNDFRPISLLPIFSKIFEKIIAEKMMKFINKNNILSASQFSFRTSSSTEMAVTSIYDKLLHNLDDKKITCSIFLDLRKAFDSVLYDIILKKLHHFGFRGTILSFFQDYLKTAKSVPKSMKKHRVFILLNMVYHRVLFSDQYYFYCT